MKKLLVICALSPIIWFNAHAQTMADRKTADKILSDTTLDAVQAKALSLLQGFSAGTSYSEVWIRDFNTFIKGSLKVHPAGTVREMLLNFFRIQGEDGNIVDGIVDTAKAKGGYDYRYSKLLPGYAAHKNTVETDQESSLIQAVRKYIDVTKDASILDEQIGGIKVMRRMEMALEYLLKDRWSARYGLITGATTIDWGDVQPETGWGVAINGKTKWAIDIYDNAMFAIALRDLIAIKPKAYTFSHNWAGIYSTVKTNARKYLWMQREGKYLPHLYLDGSPFAPDFNEKEILYSGGSICAIIAGFNTRAEISQIEKQLRKAASEEKFATIGITVYPPYPAKQFPNMQPYNYQNAGDWTWFGGRITAALIPANMAGNAYEDVKPMINRMLKNNGFYEWYDVRSGKPSGSGNFRGEAGVLFDAITELKQWAKQVKNHPMAE
jgi:hypothetical protein